MDERILLEQLQKSTIDIETNRYKYDAITGEIIEQIKKLGGYFASDYRCDQENNAIIVDTQFIPVSLPEFPTQYQDIITYIGFYDAFHSLFSVLPNFIQHWREDHVLKNVCEREVMFGTVEKVDFQSSVYKINDKYLIIFSNGLLSLINEMSTIVTYFLFINDEISYYNLMKNLQNKPEYIKEFIEKMLAYYLFSRTYWEQRRKIEYSKQFWEIRDAIQKESIKFICAHELGHIVYGHFDKDFVKDNNPNILWEKEYQADRFAAFIMFQEFGIHPVFSTVAITMVISIIEYLDRMNGNFLEKRLDQHPLSYVRRNRVGGIAREFFGVEASNAFLLTIGLTEILWDEFMEFVLYLWHQEGVKIEKNNFKAIQSILYTKYELQYKDYEAILDLILSGEEWIVKGFYNPK